MVATLQDPDPGRMPDVALMDIELRDGAIDGIEGITLLKDHWPETAVVMFTIHDTAERIFAALRAGASGYLTKPSPVDDMVRAIREAHRGGMPMPPSVARKVRHFFAGSDHDYNLTEREVEILTWMEKGAKQKEIAKALYLSHHTVDSHLRNIYQKLHVRSGIQAVAKAIRERLI
jgi:DNA-binding NarL/FixJ family response regulator